VYRSLNDHLYELSLKGGVWRVTNVSSVAQ
jgi:hypothetical protein